MISEELNDVIFGTGQTSVHLSLLLGLPISKLSVADDISADHLFAIERQHEYQRLLLEKYKNRYDAVLQDQYKTREDVIFIENYRNLLEKAHDDYKLTYADLSTLLYNDILAALGLSTMAYRDKWEYARVNHDHYYNKIRCYPNIKIEDLKYDEGVDKSTLSEYLGTMEIWQISSLCIGTNTKGKDIMSACYVPLSTDIYMPRIIFPKYAEPDIGEARFIAWNSFPTTTATTNPKLDSTGLLYDSENDGYWAYPKGQTIACLENEFISACKIYGNLTKSGFDTSFTLPLLSNFIKLNPNVNSVNTMQKTMYQVGLPLHTHNIDNSSFSTNMELSAKAKFDSRPNAGYSEGEHAMHTYKGDVKYVYNGDRSGIVTNSNLSAQQITLQYAEYNDVEVYPTYNDMPIIIYIGKK